MGYNGWLLPENERSKFLALFPPNYPDVVAHHVTLQFPAEESDPLPTANGGVIIGVADDGHAVQALVIEIDGSSTRPDGGTYHITWSLDKAKGAKPVHSNDVIAAGHVFAVPRIPVRLEPRFFR